MSTRRAAQGLAAAALFALAAFTAWASAGTFQDPLNVPARMVAAPHTGMLMAVARAGDHLVAVGPNGRILVSDGQAGVWRQVEVPTSVDLVAVHFPSPQMGWAVGHGGVVLHSSDGGRTWQKQLDGALAAATMVRHYTARESEGTPGAAEALSAARQFEHDGPIHPFLDVWFENDQRGFIVGPFNLIFATEDGGGTWVPWIDRTENPGVMNLHAVRGSGGEVYLAGEQGLLLKLDRAKQGFVALPKPYPGTYFGVLVTPKAVLAFGMRGNVYRTTDAGRTWQKSETGESAGVTAGAVLEDGRPALVSMSGSLLVGSPEGDQFSRTTLRPVAPMFGVAAAGAGRVAVVGPHGVRVEPLK